MTRDNDTSQDGWDEAREGGRDNARPYRPLRPRSDSDDTRARPRPRFGSANDFRDPSRSAYPPNQRPSQDAYEDSPDLPRQRPASQRRPVPPRDDQDQVTEPPVQRRRTYDFPEEETTGYQQPQQRPQRPRITRQSREDAYARLRRGRDKSRPYTAGGREQIEPRSAERPYTARDEIEETQGRDKSRPYTPRRIPNPEEALEETPVHSTSRRITNPEEEPYFQPARRAVTRTTSSTPRRAQPPRQRSVWSTLLIGCAGGLVTIALIAGIVAFIFFRLVPTAFPGLGIGKSNFMNQPKPIPLNITGNTTQLQVQNQVGNITIKINPTATVGTLTYTEHTKATNSSDAASEFGRITVNVKPGNNTTCPQSSCLTVNATVPNVASDSVDLLIELPGSINTSSSASNPFILNANTTGGNIMVNDFNGLLNLTNNEGNIAVQNVVLSAGSCLQTQIGSVSFTGTLGTSNGPTVNPCHPGTPITSTPDASNPQPWFEIITGTGNIDITLDVGPSANAGEYKSNAILHATIFNKGQINSGAFGIPVQQSADGSADAYGPLTQNPNPASLLRVTVDTGNINLHKASS